MRMYLWRKEISQREALKAAGEAGGARRRPQKYISGIIRRGIVPMAEMAAAASSSQRRKLFISEPAEDRSKNPIMARRELEKRRWGKNIESESGSYEMGRQCRK